MWHLFTSFILFCYVSFAEDLMDAYRDMLASLGLQGLDEVNQPYFRMF